MDSMRNQIANTINAIYSLMQKLDETTAHAQATVAAVQAAAMASTAMGYPTDYGGSYDGSGSGDGTKQGGKTTGGSTNTGLQYQLSLVGPVDLNAAPVYSNKGDSKIELQLQRSSIKLQHLATGGYTGA